MKKTAYYEKLQDYKKQKDEEINKLKSLLIRCRDELRWCGGSADFQVGGEAREGWEKGVIPLLKDLESKTKSEVTNENRYNIA